MQAPANTEYMDDVSPCSSQNRDASNLDKPILEKLQDEVERLTFTSRDYRYRSIRSLTQTQTVTQGSDGCINIDWSNLALNTLPIDFLQKIPVKFNLNISGHWMSEIDLSYCRQLQSLKFEQNDEDMHFMSFDVGIVARTGATRYEECPYDPSRLSSKEEDGWSYLPHRALRSLKVHGCGQLKELDCSNLRSSFYLTSIDASDCSQLRSFKYNTGKWRYYGEKEESFHHLSLNLDNCTLLNEVQLNNHQIGPASFHNCSSLENLSFRTVAFHIDFSGCNQLKNLAVSGGLGSIGLSGCHQLVSLKILSSYIHYVTWPSSRPDNLRDINVSNSKLMRWSDFPQELRNRHGKDLLISMNPDNYSWNRLKQGMPSPFQILAMMATVGAAAYYGGAFSGGK